MMKILPSRQKVLILYLCEVDKELLWKEVITPYVNLKQVVEVKI